MKKIIFFLIFLYYVPLCIAQKHDYNWVIGYPSGDSLSTYNSKYGMIFFDFNKKPVEIKKKWINIDFGHTNTTISNNNGELLFTTNAMTVRCANGKFAKNGDTLLWDKTWYKFGYNAQQGILALPKPKKETQYLMIYGRILPKNYKPIYTSIFDEDIGENGGIIEKNKEILNDSVTTGRITAVKHGNGRDWWVRIGKDLNTHYMFLLNQEGIKLSHKQVIGHNVKSGVGQTVFSPDGSKFVECVSVNNTIGQNIMIYNFDRCSGMLSNPYRMHFDTSAWSGLAISPNSRFLYFSDGWHVIQYDLQATDIKASETILATWDGFVDFAATGFYLMQLAPDNKIYICTSGATSYMHVIDNPDEKGLASNVRQRGIKLPAYNAWTIPNHPNYRLGALKGSPCDTLQGGVGTKEMESKTFEVEIYPNPANDYVTFSWAKPIENVTISVNDLLGRILYTAALNDNTLRLDTASFPSGVYQVNFKTPDAKLSHIAKIVVNH